MDIDKEVIQKAKGGAEVRGVPEGRILSRTQRLIPAALTDLIWISCFYVAMVSLFSLTAIPTLGSFILFIVLIGVTLFLQIRFFNKRPVRGFGRAP